jgi:hypothetical protein
MSDHPSAPPKQAAHRRSFSPEEDAIIIHSVYINRCGGWETIARRLSCRTARQCRDRWMNYLSPTVRTDPWTESEDRLLLRQVNQIGFRWSVIAHCFNGRSDNDIKNRWYSHLKYETVRDGEKFIMAPGGESLYPERKKRIRIVLPPKQNAFRFLEEQRQVRAPATQKPTEDPPPFEVEDSWETMVTDQGDDQHCPVFALFD